MKHTMRTVLGGVISAGLMFVSLDAAAQAPAPAPGYPPAGVAPAQSDPTPEPSYPAPAPTYPPAPATSPPGYPPSAVPVPPRAGATDAHAFGTGRERHFLGIHAVIGGGFGGDTLVKATYTNGSTRTLKAGGGLFVGGGVALTPLWIANRVGLGIDFEGNYQRSSIDASNGSVVFGRTGLLFAGHILVHLWDGNLGPNPIGYYLLAAGGVQYETSAKVSGSGVGSGIAGDLGTATGGMGEIGFDVLWRFLGASLTVRYTGMTYSPHGQSVDGSSVAILFGLHLDPWTTKVMDEHD